MAILTFEVKGQTLTVKSSIGRIVENSVNYLNYDIVTSDPDWIGLAKKLIITTSEGATEIGESEQEYIPNKKIISPGFQVSIVGYSINETGEELDKRITTYPIFISVSPAGPLEGSNPENKLPVPSEGDEINESFNKVYEEIGKKADQSALDAHISNKVSSFVGNEGDKNKYPTIKAVEEKLKMDAPSITREIIDSTVLKNNLEGVIIRKYAISESSGGQYWYRGNDYHLLISIPESFWGKKVFFTGGKNNGQILFFSKEANDPEIYNTEDSNNPGNYIVPSLEIQENKKRFKTISPNTEDYCTIPEGTKCVYLLREMGGTNRLPSKLEIDGYDYCTGIVYNILEQKKLLQDSLDTHINNMVEDFEGNTDNNDKYPSVKAVYDFVNQSEHITKITAANTYIWDLPPGIYTFTATDKTQKIYFYGSTPHICDEGAFLIVGGENYSGKLPPSATKFKKSIIFLKNLNATGAQIIAGISTVTYSTAEDGKVTYTAEWDGGIIESQDNRINAINSDVTINQYPSAKAVYSYVEEKANKISSNSTNALKGNVSDKGIIDISDISPIEHDLQVSVTMGSANVVGIPVVCRGKNLFGLEGRIETTFNKVQHNFTGNSVFLSYSPSNNVGSSGSFTYDPQKEEIVYNNTSSDWYGLGVDIKVDPSTYYFISQQELSALGNIGVAFYDSDGVYIGWTKEYNLTKAFQTPENAAWAVIALVCKTKNEQATFTKVQLEKGMVATSFEKYSPPQSRTTNSNGEAIGFRSIHPRTIIETQNPQLTINCEYNKDINKAYEELQSNYDGLQSNYEKLKTAIKNLGGTIE